MDKKWKKFEQVVAAIHVAENSGAAVTWNDHINKQFADTPEARAWAEVRIPLNEFLSSYLYR